MNSHIPDNLTLLLPGTFEKMEKIGNKILLPHHSDCYHPDMVQASDFVIGKAGYSTIAEVCNAGAAYGFISRANFRESDVTADFLRRRPNTLEIAQKRFEAFTLDEEINKLLELGKIPMKSKERSATDPIIVCGGPVAYNIEPMSDFFDAVFMGEGEEVDLEFTKVIKKYKEAGKPDRQAMLREVAQIEGMYVPSLYEPEYSPEGKFLALHPSG